MDSLIMGPSAGAAVQGVSWISEEEVSCLALWQGLEAQLSPGQKLAESIFPLLSLTHSPPQHLATSSYHI